MKKHTSIIMKLLALGLFPLLLLDIVLFTSSTKIIRETTTNEIMNSLKYVTASLIETYTNLYPGDYSTNVSGGVLKGSQHISGDTRLVDSIKSSAGFDCTLYFNGTAIVTTVTKSSNGARAVATSLDSDIRQIVENEQRVYTSDATVIEGTRYYSYFAPLYNTDGSVVGIVFAGKNYDIIYKQIASQVKQITILSEIFILVCTILIILFARRISKSLTQAKNFLSKVSEGDLSASLPKKCLTRRDEIGMIFQSSYSLQKQLTDIVGKITSLVGELAASSDMLTQVSSTTDHSMGEFTGAINEITQQTQTQANQTQTASVHINQIVDQLNSITTAVNTLMNNSQQMSISGQQSTKILSQLRDSNHETMDSIDRISKQTDIANTSAQEIQKTIGLIQSIAEETDLLSLNASIEAARAGAAGRGFTVVAEEIRKLADQSRSSANEIEKIIQKLLHESNLTVTVMKEVKTNIDQQQNYLHQTEQNFTMITDAITKSADSTVQIQKQIAELNTSKDAILDVIHTLSSLSQESAAVTEQALGSTNELHDTISNLSSSSVSLMDISKDLQTQLKVFKM